MDEDMMNELLKRWAKTEGMSPQDLLDWNAPGRGISIGSDEFGDMLRDPKPRDMMKKISGNARSQMVQRPSWIRRLLGLGSRGVKGLSGIGLALDMATNPSELGGQSLQEFLGQSEDGSLTDEEKMQYYQQLANIKSFDDIY